jgi:hypothetical protein
LRNSGLSTLKKDWIPEREIHPRGRERRREAERRAADKRDRDRDETMAVWRTDRLGDYFE